MGNPRIVIIDPVNDVGIQDGVIRNSVEALRFNDKGMYGGVRQGKTDDDEPSYVSGQMIIVERMNTLCDGQEKGKNDQPLVQRPPFISPEVWDKYSGLQSFMYIKDRFALPFPMIPNRYFQKNGLLHGDDQKVPQDKRQKIGVWNWKVQDYVNKDMTDSAEVLKLVDLAGDNTLQTKTVGGLATSAVNYVLDLTSPNKSAQGAGGSVDSMSTESDLCMSSIGTENRIGSFMLTLGNIRQVKNTGNKDKDGKYVKDALQKKTTGDVKDDAAAYVFINISGQIYISIESNSVMKIRMNGLFGNTKTVQLSGIERLFDNNINSKPVSFIFMPVFNGLVIAVAPTAGDWFGVTSDSTNNNIFFIEKNPGVDPMQYQAKDHVFSINNQTDIQIEAKGPPETNVGNILYLQFFNCTGTFSYTPVFFSPEARGAYYFFSGSDTVSNGVNVDQPYYRFLPVWCKNKTSAALYPLSDGSNEVYPMGYTAGSTDPSRETPQAIPVVLQRDFRLQINSARGYSKDPGDGSGKLDYYIDFATTLLDASIAVTPAAGESVIVEGSHAGTYKVTSATSGLITCDSPNESVFSETGLSDVMRLADPSVKDRKIVFGISSGKQEKTIDADEEKQDQQVAFTKSMERMGKEKYSRFPSQLFGFLRVTIDMLQNNIDNLIENQFDIGDNWAHFITNVSVTHNESAGTTGSMTIDRYGLSQYCANYDRNILIQQVAGLNLGLTYVKTQIDAEADNVKTYAINLSERSNDDGNDYIGDPSWFYNQDNLGLLLKGIAYGQGINDSYSANEMSVPLFGLQRKLEEIKIINAPFFDGQNLRYVLEYLASYGNVAMNLDNAKPDDLLPASSNISVAIVDFKLGTSVWDAMHTVAELTAHMFVLQPDGVIWWYKISEVNGLPQAKSGHQMWSYPNTRVVSATSEPDYSQFYNHLILMAMQAPTTNVKNPLEVVDLPMQPLIAGARLKNTNPNISWSKLVVTPMTSFFTEKELNKQTYIQAKRAQSILWNGNTTIPGNLGIRLFDTFSNNLSVSGGTKALSDDSEMRGEFLVAGITHNVDIVSKNFTTQLNICMIGNAWYDASGVPNAEDLPAPTTT